MASFGNLSITLSLTFAIYALFALFYGGKTNRRDLVKSGEHAVYAVFFFVTMAVTALVYLLMTSDFSLEYVANYSNRDLNVFYKFAALWGGQKGSLLFWTWILALFVAVAAWINRRYPGKLVPYALGIATMTTVFFLVINKFGANPFAQLVIDHGDGALQSFTAQDGRGLNPLLQHPAMVIHPPLLYLGYIGFVIPFALCMAALLTRELGNNWIKMARRWTLMAWMLLGAGVMLGGKWAYVELGRGGEGQLFDGLLNAGKLAREAAERPCEQPQGLVQGRDGGAQAPGWLEVDDFDRDPASDPVQPADALLDRHRVPWQVKQHQARTELEVTPLTTAFGRNQHRWAARQTELGHLDIALTQRKVLVEYTDTQL